VNYIRQDELVTLNGTTPVSMVATNAFRPRSIIVVTAGTSNLNEGDITLRVVSAGAVRNKMLAEKSNDQDCHYTVPAGKTAYPVFVYEEINKNEDITIDYQITDGITQIYRSLILSSIYQNTNAISFVAPPIPLPEKTDLRIRAESNGPSSAPSVILQFIEVDD